jgi:hypothetical protein
MFKRKIGWLLLLFILFALFLSSNAEASAAGLRTDSIDMKARGIAGEKKREISGARKKLGTDLLQLIDERFLLPGQTKEEVRKQMQSLKQFRPAGSVKRVNKKVAGDLVYVYISLRPSAGTDVVLPYAWEVTDRDESNHLVAAWVEVQNLESLAKLEAVRFIHTVVPPVIRTGS